MKRVSPNKLYEPSYSWYGECSCGANEWTLTTWGEGKNQGYHVECVICGFRECEHADGSRHTTDGVWTAQSRKTPEPTGCPTILDGYTPRRTGAGCFAEPALAGVTG